MREIEGKTYLEMFSKYSTPSDEGARFVRKNRRKIISRTDRANEVNETFARNVRLYYPYRQYTNLFIFRLYYMAFLSFSPLFVALCLSSDVAVYLTPELVKINN